MDRHTPSTGMHFNLRKFDPSTIGDDRTCMVIGKRNTGKSVLTKDILYFKRHIPIGLVMSQTESGNGWYKKWVPDSFVYNGFDASKVDMLIQQQQKLCERNEKSGKPVRKTFLVLDDCMFDKKVMKQKCIRELFFNGRHYGIFFITTSQYVADAGPEIRANCDYVFVMKENIRSNRERLWKWYFGVFPTFAAFEAAMDACTNDFGCLVLDNTTQSTRLEDNVFWYKAKVRNDFRMGSPLAWHFHAKSFRRREGPEGPEGPDGAAAKKTGMGSARGGGVSVRMVKGTAEEGRSKASKGATSRPSKPRPPSA